jgi:hypothetical protein
MREQEARVAALKVEKNRFYVLRVGKDYWIYASEDDVMLGLKEKIKPNKNFNHEDVQVTKAQIFKRNWKIQEIPWFKALVEIVLENFEHK